MVDVASLIKERFGELSEIQKISIPKILSGENVLILAPTGYGKTESALLPVLEKIKNEENGICALYITPLRALSRDIKERFDWWCQRLDISHDIRTGDTTANERTKQRKNPPKILLTTIESLQALMLGPIMKKAVKHVRFVIVDEIHDVLDNKRGAQLSISLERLARFANFQRIGISATVANETEAAKLIFGSREFSVCEVGKKREIKIDIEETQKIDEKIQKIKSLVEKNRSLVFVNTRSSAEELGAELKKLEAPIEVHHGSLSKEVRINAEDKFKSGLIKSLICTSSLELGIDIGDVSLVIQYGSPHQVFRLIQRVGRSGHSMKKTPHGIIFSSDTDDLLESEVIRNFALNGSLENKRLEVGALDVIAHQLTGLCLDSGQINLKEAHEIFQKSGAYGINYEKLRMIALQLYSEGILYYDEVEEEVFIKAKPRGRVYYATYLSTIPKMKRFLMKDIISNKIISSLDEEFVINLESGVSFFSKGNPWRVVDITENEVIAEPSIATEIVVPSWSGEDIPVSFEIAQAVGKLRKGLNEIPIPDDKTVIMEIITDVVVIHACFGSVINEAISRLFSLNLSRLLGESVKAVTDPYRIMIKLPFPLKEEQLKNAFFDIRNIRNQLEDSLINSSLLKFKFLHVGRMFGLLSEDAQISGRFIEAMRNSVVYEETIRSIFFKYFDPQKTQEIIEKIKSGKINFIIDKRQKPSFFAKIGLDRISANDSGGVFAPREKIIEAFKDMAINKNLRLVCLNCKSQKLINIALSQEKIVCHNCNQQALGLLDKEGEPKKEIEFSAGLIRNYGKRALIALSTYGIGPKTADRILRKLHRDEGSFYLELIEAQKLFIKNKKYWKFD